MTAVKLSQVALGVAGAVVGLGALAVGVVVGESLAGDSSDTTAAVALETVSIQEAAIVDPLADPAERGLDPLPTSSIEVPAAWFPHLGADAEAPDPTPPAPVDQGQAPPVGSGEPFLPPTMPAGFGDDGSDPDAAPDADAEPVVRPGVAELEPFDLIDLLDPLDSPAATDPAAPVPPPLPFADPCAPAGSDDTDDTEDADDTEDCPEGTGGTIVLLGDGGGSADPLIILAEAFDHPVTSLDWRCPFVGFGDDSVYRPVIVTNNPANLTVTYGYPRITSIDQRGRLDVPIDEVATITYRSAEGELERWIDRQVEGLPTWANPQTGVHNCLELSMLDPDRDFLLDIRGVDDFGSETRIRVAANRHRDRSRPPVAFRPSGDAFDRWGMAGGRLVVPYDASREYVLMAVLPRTGDRSSTLSCTDIERDVIDGRHPSDPSLAGVSVGSFAHAPDSPFDPRFGRAAIGEIHMDEGSTYDLCSWVVEPGRSEVEPDQVVDRDQIRVRAPRALRLRVSITGGELRVPAERNSMALAAFVPYGYHRHEVAFTPFPSTDLAAGPFEFASPLVVDERVTGQPGLDTDEFFTDLTGPDGAVINYVVSLPSDCLDEMSCARPSARVVEHRIPICEAGIDPCRTDFLNDIGRVDVLFESFGGPDGPPSGAATDDGWQIEGFGAFPEGEPWERPATPQIVESRSGLTPLDWDDDRRPGISMRITFDRPVRLEATPRSYLDRPQCTEPETYASLGFDEVHSFRWPELCFADQYRISLLAVDEDGNELDLRNHRDGGPLPWARSGGWGLVDLPGRSVSSIDIHTVVHRLGDGIAPHRVVTRVSGYGFDEIDDDAGAGACTSSRWGHEWSAESTRGRELRLGETNLVEVRVTGTGRTPGCGNDGLHRSVHLTAELSLDELLDGPQTLVFDTDDAVVFVVVDVTG